MEKLILLVFYCLFLFQGCDNTDLGLVAGAGIDAVKAVTLSDEDVKIMAAEASKKSDAENKIAPLNSNYAKRLARLVGNGYSDEGYQFDFKVYASPTINAFAMADGTIRIYSGLMDMMDDDELMFVVGHEIGHVVKKHIKKKIMLAYAASAVRKGVASQEGIVGGIARSSLGGLVQALLNAQFSQEEERQADDYGILYLRKKKKNINAAVSALEKLATLGNNHSFLSSHPAPGQRAKRLLAQVETPGKIGQPTKAEGLFQSVKDSLLSKLGMKKGK